MSGREEHIRENAKNENHFLSGVYEWMQTLVTTLILVVLFLAFAGKNLEVIGSSMVPTLMDRERMIISDLFFTPEYGDIIVFAKKSFENGTPLVKRVIATEGQTVDIDPLAGAVYVDGQMLNEPYINEATYTLYNIEFPVTVPEGHVFVMGDNRNHSKDSRHGDVGMVDTREILGKVYGVIFPFSDLQYLG